LETLFFQGFFVFPGKLVHFPLGNWKSHGKIVLPNLGLVWQQRGKNLREDIHQTYDLFKKLWFVQKIDLMSNFGSLAATWEKKERSLKIQKINLNTIYYATKNIINIWFVQKIAPDMIHT
jgi:hypothetical protein